MENIFIVGLLAATFGWLHRLIFGTLGELVLRTFRCAESWN